MDAASATQVDALRAERPDLCGTYASVLERPRRRHYGRGTMDPNERACCSSEADSPERQRLGEALEAGGFEVVECPGPTEPDDDCVGLRTGLCPLLTDVDVVVLDVQLEANDVEFRTTSEELLNLYRSGRPVVALGLRGRRLDEEAASAQALAGRRRVGSRRPSARRTRCGERAE